MHAMLSTAPGGPETLEWTETPTPEPKKGEVRIAIKAAGVNFPDTLIIRDLYQVKPPRPFALAARSLASSRLWAKASHNLQLATECWQ